MSNKLKELFEQENISNKSLIIRLRNKELQEELIKETSYLPDTVSISERAYCYKNHYTECPVCRFCGNPLRFHKMNNVTVMRFYRQLIWGLLLTL